MYDKYFKKNTQTINEDFKLSQPQNIKKKAQLNLLSQMDESSLSQHLNLMKTAMRSPETRKMIEEQHGLKMSDKELEIMNQFITPDLMKQSLNFMKNQGRVFYKSVDFRSIRID